MKILFCFCLPERTTYDEHFGGVVAMTTRDFALVNGYLNGFWGWGAEDDDLYRRVMSHNFTVTRPHPVKWARFTAQNHRKDKANPDRFIALERSAELRTTDGLFDLRYRTVRAQLEPLYTHILVDLNPMKIELN